jgi:septum formation protein
MVFQQQPLILASSSPRRRELLAATGVPFEIIVESVDETALLDESAENLVARLSHAKARGVAEKFPMRWVLGADTVVVVDDEILGKPIDDEDAVRMLLKIQGREHTVTSGFSLLRADDNALVSQVCHTTVQMAPVSEERIRRYVASGEPRDKAGAYAIQGAGLQFVAEIRGSYTNVVGLPLVEVLVVLNKVGY